MVHQTRKLLTQENLIMFTTLQHNVEIKETIGPEQLQLYICKHTFFWKETREEDA